MTRRKKERTGLIPRSILRTSERFLKQLFNRTEISVIEEFRISRYQVIVSVRSLIALIFVPVLVHVLCKSFLIQPGVEYLWNEYNNEIFLNSYQQNRALADFQKIQEKLYFESFINPNYLEQPEFVSKQIQDQTVEMAKNYNFESIEAITNLITDYLSFVSLYIVFVVLRKQIIILKAFLSELLYSLSDTTKSFLLILGSDLLVGFHSPRGWEVFLEWLLRHFGLPESALFMSLFVATFPVFIDTVFKYWIFRSLNRISPSTVAVYHRIIE
jgi:hypothetical protein